MKFSKIKLTVLWVIGGYIFSIIGVILSVIYWSYVNPDWKLNIVSEIIGNSMMLPVGWFFCSIIPMSLPSSVMSWISIGAFIWAYKFERMTPLYLSYLACVVFGVFWPMVFWTMMSV